MPCRSRHARASSSTGNGRRISFAPLARLTRRHQGWAAEWLGALAKARSVETTPFVQNSLARAVDRIDQHVRATRGAGNETQGDVRAGRRAAPHCPSARVSRIGRHSRITFEDIAGSDPAAREFEDAADAVVDRRPAALESLIRARPALFQLGRPASTASRCCTTWPRTASRTFRQRTPPNAVDDCAVAARVGRRA